MTDKSTAKFAKTFVFKTPEREFKINMTFGLLTELSAGFQSAEDIQLAILDQRIVFDLINKAIAERDAEGQRLTNVKQPNVEQLDPDLDEFEAVSTWILGHVLTFFGRRAKAFANATLETQAELGPTLARLNKAGASLKN